MNAITTIAASIEPLPLSGEAPKYLSMKSSIVPPTPTVRKNHPSTAVSETELDLGPTPKRRRKRTFIERMENRAVGQFHK